MTKGDRTREEILHKAAVLFNERGYSAASMQEITKVTGIQRGGIYNHFESKEQLAVESFTYAARIRWNALSSRLAGDDPPAVRLRTIADVFVEYHLTNPTFPNGCVVLNTAVEAKRHMLSLREKAQESMRTLLDLLSDTVRSGQNDGTIRPETDPEMVATVMVSTLEGAMVLSKLYDDPAPLRFAAEHLHRFIDTIVSR